MNNILLTIQYDGTGYSGWQRQPDKRTVQGEIEKALTTLCRQPIEICGTSRTDAGVHAYGQAANFKGNYKIPVENIKKAVNGLLPEDIYIISAEKVEEDFHARFSAIGKTYEYKIISTKEKDIFSRNYHYNIYKELDIEPMRDAAAYFIGTHDFKSFMASGSSVIDTIRTIYALNIMEEKIDYVKGFKQRNINIEITGNGFLYNMVRIISGTLVDTGLGKMKPNQIANIIKAKDRRLSGHTAPPSGLYLKKIYFNERELKEKIK